MKTTTSSTNLPLRLEWRTPEELEDHPKNWKKHPGHQLTSLDSFIGDVGWAGALLFNESTGRLLDGHARKKLSEARLVDGKLPVLVGSWTEAQEKKILALLDPIGSLAETDDDAFRRLAEELEFHLGDPLMRVIEDLAGEFDGLDLEADLDTSPKIEGMTYKVVITCENETQQLELLERFESEGLSCQALIS